MYIALLIICKKSYSGTVKYSLSHQKVNTFGNPFLMLRTVNCWVYISVPSRAGLLLYRRWFYPPPSNILWLTVIPFTEQEIRGWTKFHLDRLPFRLASSSLQKGTERIKMWISYNFTFHKMSFFEFFKTI